MYVLADLLGLLLYPTRWLRGFARPEVVCLLFGISIAALLASSAPASRYERRRPLAAYLTSTAEAPTVVCQEILDETLQIGHDRWLGVACDPTGPRRNGEAPECSAIRTRYENCLTSGPPSSRFEQPGGHFDLKARCEYLSEKRLLWGGCMLAVQIEIERRAELQRLCQFADVYGVCSGCVYDTRLTGE